MDDVAWVSDVFFMLYLKQGGSCRLRKDDDDPLILDILVYIVGSIVDS